MSDISEERPSESSPYVCEPIDASNANASTQVAVTGMAENKKALVWIEEGEVQRLSDTVGSLKEELKDLKTKFGDASSATEDKLHGVCACIKELEDKIEVVLHRKENQQVKLFIISICY